MCSRVLLCPPSKTSPLREPNYIYQEKGTQNIPHMETNGADYSPPKSNGPQRWRHFFPIEKRDGRSLSPISSTSLRSAAPRPAADERTGSGQGPKLLCPTRPRAKTSSQSHAAAVSCPAPPAQLRSAASHVARWRRLFSSSQLRLPSVGATVDMDDAPYLVDGMPPRQTADWANFRPRHPGPCLTHVR